MQDTGTERESVRRRFQEKDSKIIRRRKQKFKVSIKRIQRHSTLLIHPGGKRNTTLLLTPENIQHAQGGQTRLLI